MLIYHVTLGVLNNVKAVILKIILVLYLFLVYDYDCLPECMHVHHVAYSQCS